MKRLKRDEVPPVLQELVQAFLNGAGSWTVSVDEDTGGAGLCEEASGELAQWLREHGLHRAVPAFRYAGRGPLISYGDHPIADAAHYVTVVRFDERFWFIDLTPRQFDDTLPFPLFGEIEYAEVTWLVKLAYLATEPTWCVESTVTISPAS